MKTPTVLSLDHLVLTVADVALTCDFYTRVLGMRHECFGPGNTRSALVFGAQKINLHQCDRKIVPHASAPTRGSADICLLIEPPLEDAMAHVQANGVDILEGPVQRTGAQGPLISFYFRDPDGNLIELAVAATESNIKHEI